MPKYRVLRRSFLKIDGNPTPCVCEPGQIVSFSGTPGSALEPIDAEAKAAFVAWGRTRPARPRAWSLAGDRHYRQVTERVEKAKGGA